MEAPAALLDIEDVTLYRGDHRVFDHLSLRIPARQNTAILGPNGSGKTTLLQLLTRELYHVDRPGSSVRILGQSRWEVLTLRRQLGVVSQDLQFTYRRGIRAVDVVLSGFFSSIGLHRHFEVSAEQRRAAEAALERLAVGHLRDIAFSRLSTGEQRRCLLARALVHRPHTLILDEPTAGLDMQARFDLLRTLRELMREGTTLILVTHELGEVLPEISHVILLRSCTIFAEGPKKELLREDRLSELYGVPLALLEKSGFYQAVPA